MSTPTKGDITLEVVAREDAARDVVCLTLARTDRSPLPAWEPGAHVDLFLPTGDVRQYSLCSDPADPTTWRVAVLREEEGRGGSRWIADRLATGDTLTAAGPRSHFPFDARGAAPAVLIAGGIGITPILAMAAAGAEIVCCGPTRLIDAVTVEAHRAGVPLTVEHFEPAELTAPVWEETFEVELAMSGMTIEVGPGQSVLSAIEDAGVLVLSSCTEGTCGTCETPVLEGEVDHRDSILSESQRARNDTMFVCVSRAACPRLVLDL